MIYNGYNLNIKEVKLSRKRDITTKIAIREVTVAVLLRVLSCSERHKITASRAIKIFI